MVNLPDFPEFPERGYILLLILWLIFCYWWWMPRAISLFMVLKDRRFHLIEFYPGSQACK